MDFKVKNMHAEIKYILGALEINNPTALAYRARLIEALDDSLALMNFADILKKESQATKDPPDDRIPYYDFFFAVAGWENNNGTAKETLAKVVHDFRIRNLTLNEALGEWLFSIFHYESKKEDRAQRACETALTLLQQLITRSEEESKYQKVRGLKKHLWQLINYQKSIAETPTREKHGSFEAPSASKIRAPIKSKLQNFHDELDSIYEHLKEQKIKIPHTLVAAKFYIYKLLAPSHSVYSKVAPPATRREKEVYDELLEKVRFFEVVEQLVQLEQEYNPGANREKILIKINQEWDQEVGS